MILVLLSLQMLIAGIVSRREADTGSHLGADLSIAGGLAFGAGSILLWANPASFGFISTSLLALGAGFAVYTALTLRAAIAAGRKRRATEEERFLTHLGKAGSLPKD